MAILIIKLCRPVAMKKNKPNMEQPAPIGWKTIFRTLDECRAANIRVVARVRTGLPDNGTPFSGMRFCDLEGLKWSDNASLRKLLDKVIDNKPGHGTGESEVWDMTCDLGVRVYDMPTLQTRVVGGLPKETHKCGVVGFGANAKGHSRPNVTGTQLGGADHATTTARPPTNTSDCGGDLVTESLYVPAVIESGEFIELRVELRVPTSKEIGAGKTVDVRHGGLRTGATQHYMPQEKLAIHMLKRSGLMRHLPSEDRTSARCYSRLNDALKKATINGVQASRILYFSADNSSSTDFRRFIDSVPALQGSLERVGVVIGEFKVAPEIELCQSTEIHLIGIEEALPMSTTVAIATVQRAASRLKALRRKAHGQLRVLAVAMVRIKADGRVEVARLGSLLLTSAYVFVESLGEALESNAMAIANVDHEKYIDIVPEYGFIPDFGIHGYEYLVLMERWGMLLPHYRAHMDKKIVAAIGCFPLVQSDVKFDPLGRPVYPEAIFVAIREHEYLLGLGSIQAPSNCDANRPEMPLERPLPEDEPMDHCPITCLPDETALPVIHVDHMPEAHAARVNGVVASLMQPAAV